MSIYGEVQAFNQEKWVELFVLDATNIGGGISRFHAGVNDFYTDVVWQGESYQVLPLICSGFEYNGDKFPRPRIQVANITGIFSPLIKNYNNLIGCKVTRKRTAVRYLDAANFLNGNPTANPSEHTEDEIFFITQKTIENKLMIEFELGSALDLQGVYLPRRQCAANVCTFRYRGEECGYTGEAVAKEDDSPTTDVSLDKCSKKLSGCKIRWGDNGELPFGGFPGVNLIGG